MSKQELFIQGWAVIDGFPFHRVTIDGRVQTRFSTGNHVPKDEWRDIKTRIKMGGYLAYGVQFEKKPLQGTVHRLVATYFVENPNGHKWVDHKDGNKLNNNASNLEWVTASENTIRAYNLKLNPNIGEDHHKAILDTEKVKIIKELLLKGKKPSIIAYLFDVDDSTILDIKAGRSWIRVTD